jgi:hypothetical protein
VNSYNCHNAGELHAHHGVCHGKVLILNSSSLEADSYRDAGSQELCWQLLSHALWYQLVAAAPYCLCSHANIHIPACQPHLSTDSC